MLSSITSEARHIKSLEMALRTHKQARDTLIRRAAERYTEREIAEAAELSAPRVHQIVVKAQANGEKGEQDG